MARIVSTSTSRSVTEDRLALNTLPGELPKLPEFCVTDCDTTNTRLVPMPRNCSATKSWTAWPSDTSTITAETPMAIPSVVRAARSRLEPRLVSAIRMLSLIICMAAVPYS